MKKEKNPGHTVLGIMGWMRRETVIHPVFRESCNSHRTYDEFCGSLTEHASREPGRLKFLSHFTLGNKVS